MKRPLPIRTKLSTPHSRRALAGGAVILCVPLLLFAALAHAQAVEQGNVAVAQLEGDTITLQADEVDIRTLLRLLAKARRMNIVAGPEVTGTISVNLFEVPFRDGLNSILGIGGYTQYRKGNIVYVTTEASKAALPIETHDLRMRVYTVTHADPQQVLASIREFISPSGKVVVSSDGGDGGGESGGAETVARAKIIVRDAPEYLAVIDRLIDTLDEAPFSRRVFEIGHAQPDAVLSTISGFLSPAGSAMRGAGNMIVVQDSPEYLADITELIGQLNTPPRQVLISSHILSVTHGDDMDVGVEFDSSSIAYSTALSSPLPLVGDFGRDVTTLETGSTGIFSTIVRDHEQFFLDAFSQKSNVETLSAPQLLAVDGQQATIQIGESLGYPVTVTTENGVTTRSTLFLEVGTLLRVTPRISEDDLIRLEIHPEVSSGTVTQDLPQKTTTQATTVMSVRNGETVLIGGLLNLSKQRVRRQVPILGDIPLLGLLFGRSTWKNTKRELIILITPYIVGPEATLDMERQQMTVDRYETRLLTHDSDISKFLSNPKRRPLNLLEERLGDDVELETDSEQ